MHVGERAVRAPRKGTMEGLSKSTWLFCALALMACSPEEEEDSSADGGASDAGAQVSDTGLPALADATIAQDASAPRDASIDAAQDAALPTVTRPFPSSGISGNVAGSVVTYTNVTLVPNNSGDGLLKLEAAASDYLSKWRIFVPSAPGSYDCDDAGDETVVQLISGAIPTGVGSGKGSCTVNVVRADQDGIEGTFVASLLDGTGALQTVTDGHFAYEKYGPPTGGDGLSATDQGVSFLVDGQRHTYLNASPLVFETYTGLVAMAREANSPGAPLGIQLHSLPNETGTHRCGEGASYRAVNVWFYWKGAFYRAGARQSMDPKGPAGSACEINLTSVGTLDGYNYAGKLEGTFSGTFVKDDGSASVVVTNGSLRLLGTP
jgi:hypothetical protein